MRRTPYKPGGLKRLECSRCEDNMAAYQQFFPVTQCWYPLCPVCWRNLQRVLFMFLDPDRLGDEE
ncbi:MAG: hypothetical protein ACYTFQ_25930, partial [Planctomycetota bacterium]